MRKTKRQALFFSLLLAVITLSFSAVVCHSETAYGSVDTQKIAVLIEEDQVNFIDQDPVIIQDRVMVPMRAVFQHKYVQAEVKWESLNQSITATDQTGRKVIFKIGNHNYQVINMGKTETKYSDVAPVIENNRTLLPLRVLSEALNFQVDWIGAERKVEINEKPGNSLGARKLMPPRQWEMYLKTGCISSDYT
jgi:hypothetical protein